MDGNDTGGIARRDELERIIRRLHAGAGVSEVRREFGKLIEGTSAAELAALEQTLMDSGFPPGEIQRLCEVHYHVFSTALKGGRTPSEAPGHPIHSMKEENRQARRRVRRLLWIAWRSGWGGSGVREREQALDDLGGILIHYTRKENQLFPYLERHGFTAPTRVMWGKHDETRTRFKEARATAGAGGRAFATKAATLAAGVRTMILMEERILLPEASRLLSTRDWAEIRAGEDAIGFAWIAPGAMYDAGLVLAGSAPTQAAHREEGTQGERKSEIPQERPLDGGVEPYADRSRSTGNANGLVGLNTGALPADLLDLALRNMPVEISVVDENDRVAYYSDSSHRIFPRSPAAIGRSVRNCHPQKSVAIVENILESFKRGEKQLARFWLDVGDRKIVIEYRALRDADGRYRGTLEITQDATTIRALEGQRRLPDWE